MSDIGLKFETLYGGTDEKRSTARDFHAAVQFPVSGVLTCRDWPADIHVELINYHYRGACIRVPEATRSWLCDIDHQDVSFDFYLGRQCLKRDLPIRIAWNQLTDSGMLGIEFLEDPREFVDRGERYLCHHEIAPQIKSPDPLDINRYLYFKVIDISRAGMLLSTSLTNKHLFPGMTLQNAQLGLPGEAPLRLCLTVENIREAPLEGCFHLGVTVRDTDADYERLMAGYLTTLSPNFLQKDPRDTPPRDARLRGKRLKPGLTFRVVNSAADYQEVLELRYQGYGSKGKLSQGATIDSQGEGLDREGTIIGAYLSGKLVATMELRFGDQHTSFRTFKIIPRSKLNIINPANTVEVNRLVVHPSIQGTDVLIGMVQKAHAIVMAHGGKDILFLATDKLALLYRRIGCVELGIRAPHPYLKDEHLNAMMLKREAFLDGRFLNPSTWEQLYRATNDYFQKITGSRPAETSG